MENADAEIGLFKATGKGLTSLTNPQDTLDTLDRL